MRKIWIALVLMAPCLFAYGDENSCKEVSGGFVTNILSESGTVNGQMFGMTTLGTATGDLAGALGVYIFSVGPGPNNSTQAKVHHHWVTTAGDTIFLADATATTYQVGPISGVFAAADDGYVVNIIGGTGRFAGATGQISNTAVLDTVHNTAVGRYHGWICFAKP